MFLSLALFRSYALETMFFYSDTCPHCAKEEIFLSSLESKYPEFKVSRYEVSRNKDNQKLFQDVARKLKQNASSVPFLVVGNEVVIGYQDDNTTGKTIENLVRKHLSVDVSETSSSSMSIPVFGTIIDLKKLSLPLLTVVIGILDGFNPCAMWVLLFLISMLLGTENKRKMWLLGAAFILTSGVIYFLFLSAWLNIFLFIGYTQALKVFIGFLAAYMGLKSLDEYRKYKTGCEVSEKGNRKEIFQRIRNIIERNNLLLSLIGIVILAVTVNFVELLCSAGLPAVYTQILSTSNVSGIWYYLYLSLYILFFMLDDLIVFIIAMVTLETVGISSKYTHLSHLVGGVVMLIIGILMLFRPDILMFK